jgi:hypothetical protein
MSKYEEKMKALEVLKDAIDAVNNATDAIDRFAKANGMKPQVKEDEKTVDLIDLAEMVSEETGMKEGCVYTALECAFDLIKDLDLTVTVAEDEDDDE